jgi:hypothetical protein
MEMKLFDLSFEKLGFYCILGRKCPPPHNQYRLQKPKLAHITLLATKNVVEKKKVDNLPDRESNPGLPRLRLDKRKS